MLKRKKVTDTETCVEYLLQILQCAPRTVSLPERHSQEKSVVGELTQCHRVTKILLRKFGVNRSTYSTLMVRRLVSKDFAVSHRLSASETRPVCPKASYS